MGSKPARIREGPSPPIQQPESRSERAVSSSPIQEEFEASGLPHRLRKWRARQRAKREVLKVNPGPQSLSQEDDGLPAAMTHSLRKLWTPESPRGFEFLRRKKIHSEPGGLEAEEQARRAAASGASPP